MKEILVTRYLSKDGVEWHSSQEAINHENYLDFCEWYKSYENNKIIAGGEIASAESIYCWLMENRSLIKKWVFK
jgi:hypothetical protein